MTKINYKIVIFILYFFISNTLMAQNNKLKVGDKVPFFTLKDQNNNDFSIKNILGKQNMVIYFYPKDNTSICTKEACKFRDEYESFSDLNTVVIGISSDSVATHKDFILKYSLPFTLLSDTTQKVRKLFRVPKNMGFIPGRVTYVINKNGEIMYIFNSMTNAEKHVNESLRILQQ